MDQAQIKAAIEKMKADGVPQEAIEAVLAKVSTMKPQPQPETMVEKEAKGYPKGIPGVIDTIKKVLTHPYTPIAADKSMPVEGITWHDLSGAEPDILRGKLANMLLSMSPIESLGTLLGITGVASGRGPEVTPPIKTPASLKAGMATVLDSMPKSILGTEIPGQAIAAKIRSEIDPLGVNKNGQPPLAEMLDAFPTRPNPETTRTGGAPPAVQGTINDLPLAKQMELAALPIDDGGVVGPTAETGHYVGSKPPSAPPRDLPDMLDSRISNMPPTTPGDINALPLYKQMEMLPEGGSAPEGRAAGGAPPTQGGINDLPLARQMEILAHMEGQQAPETTRTGDSPNPAQADINSLPLIKQMDMLPSGRPNPEPGRMGEPPPQRTVATTGEDPAIMADVESAMRNLGVKDPQNAPPGLREALLRTLREDHAGKSFQGTAPEQIQKSRSGLRMQNPQNFMNDVAMAESLVKQGFNPETAIKIIAEDDLALANALRTSLRDLKSPADPFSILTQAMKEGRQ